MARDRISTSEQFRTVIDELRKDDVLGLQIVENKEAFMLSVALGIDNPTEVKKKVGLFLNTALKTTDKALIASVLLGTISDDNQIDQYANLDSSSDLCEQCAETGYQVLQKKYNDAECDTELLERRMLKELEMLYLRNVKNDL